MFLTEDAENKVRAYFVDDTDFKTPEDAISTGAITVKIRKEGAGSWNTISPTITNVGEGEYEITLSSSNCNTGGQLSIKVEASGAVTWYDQHQIVDTVPGDQDFAVTVADAERIWAVGATMSYDDIAGHADADSTNLSATTRPNCLILANAILGVVGKTEIVGSAGNIYKSNGTTIAVARTVTYAGAGSEGVAGLS